MSKDKTIETLHDTVLKVRLVFFDIVSDGGVIDLMYDIEIENSAAGQVDYHLDIRAK